MSLNVDVVVRGPAGGFDVLDTPEGCDDSAGFEVWRQKVWGSDVVRSLGARYLPLLDGDWMEVATEDLPLFLQEILLLRAHLDLIATTVGVHPDGIESRLDNIEAATLRAQRLGARVLIW
ncbi:hypothetical protein [Streptomyces brasiliensis]|uniref:Uncharacterized protein n=1 Tax=Streptomyces brasiliensis TaxID=1954 RepID=A0A917L9A9_9ACTN|nr:hypothetical protein [Streptomyces brasiliensis]GGJ54085.1 hypothetical protein GCM10010121_075950 [Streptomyces brasiliensis]